jgi:hypothetical protein
MNKVFTIKNTTYLNPPKDYDDENLYPNFQEKLDSFKFEILESTNSLKNKTYYKFGDGDYYFLNKIPKGSAKPGKRALKISYSKLNHQPFIDGYIKNDKYASLITPPNISKFRSMLHREPDFPSEILYGLVSNKWLFENITKKIGIIGAKPKIRIIKKLMEHEEYKDYLKLDKFDDYISIDQNFACDNLESTKKKLYKQLEKSKSDIFLVGIGHVKSGILNEMKNIKPAVYLDVGIGIDALAGVVNLYRPFFGSWRNYKVSNHNYLYRNVDVLINNFGSLGNQKEL